MIGMQFNAVGGDELPLSTAAILSEDMAGFNEDGDYATELQVWNGIGYTKYGWSGTSGTDILEESEFDNQWLDDQLEMVEDDVVVPFGHGVWIKAGSAGSITFTK